MENNSRYCSPLRYPGGKACIFPFVSKVFYENKLIGVDYAEPYAGGAGLALKLLYEEYVNQIYINDLDRSIYSFWKCVVDDHVRLCDWISDVEVNVDNWIFYKELFDTNEKLRDIDIAKRTFFLNRTNVSGVLKGGMIGGYSQKGKYKIDARFNKDDLIKRIERIAKFKSRIVVTNYDGLTFINKMNKKQEDMLIYLDPPYFQKGADLYLNFYKKEDHRKLANRVHAISKKWMVSYDNNDFILNLYNQRRKILYQLSQSASNRVGDEVLIFSDKMKYSESMCSLKQAIEI